MFCIFTHELCHTLHVSGFSRFCYGWLFWQAPLESVRSTFFAVIQLKCLNGQQPVESFGYKPLYRRTRSHVIKESDFVQSVCSCLFKLKLKVCSVFTKMSHVNKDLTLQYYQLGSACFMMHILMLKYQSIDWQAIGALYEKAVMYLLQHTAVEAIVTLATQHVTQEEL